MIRLLAAAVLGLLAAPLFAQSSTPMVGSDATYALTRGMITLGEARFRLTPLPEAHCWRYEYQAKPAGLTKLFIGEVGEQSEFCVVDDVIRSRHFEYQRSDKSKDNFDLSFDWQARTVRSSSGEIRELQAGMVDRLAMQIVVQRWVVAQDGKPGPAELSVTKVENKRVRQYRFRITGLETLTVPAGKIDTVRVERVDDPKKNTRFWLAPSRGYMAVRVEQIKDGDEELKMVLK